MRQEDATLQAILATDGVQGYIVYTYDGNPLPGDFNIVYNCGTESVDFLKGTVPYSGNSDGRGLWVYRLDNNTESFVNSDLECTLWEALQPNMDDLMPDVDFNEDCPCSSTQAMYDIRYKPLGSFASVPGIDDGILTYLETLKGREKEYLIYWPFFF